MCIEGRLSCGISTPSAAHNSAMWHTVTNDSCSEILFKKDLRGKMCKKKKKLEEKISKEWYLLNVLCGRERLTSHLAIVAFYRFLDTDRKNKTHDFVSSLRYSPQTVSKTACQIILKRQFMKCVLVFFFNCYKMKNDPELKIQTGNHSLPCGN